MELVSKKVLSAIIFIIVLTIMIFSTLKNVKNVSNNDLIFLHMKGKVESCNIAPEKCYILICNEKTDCSEEEKKESDNYLKFYDSCLSEPNKDECNSVLFDKIQKAINKEDSQLLSKFVKSNNNNNYYNNNNLNNNANNLKDFEISNINVKIDRSTLSPIQKKTYDKLKNLKISIFNNGLTLLEKDSKKNGINPLFAFYVLHRESRGDFWAISPTGCAGLFQFCYTTAFKDKRFQAIFGTGGQSCKGKTYQECKSDTRFDPQKSIEAGTKYLGILAKAYNNNIYLILTAYNAGSKVANMCKDQIQSSSQNMINCIATATKKQYNSNAKVKEVLGYLGEIQNNFEVASNNKRSQTES